MPFKKLTLVPKEAKDARGTKQASEMLELMVDNWDQLQEKYNDQTEAEKEEMCDHFNSAIENLGDTLFGDEPNVDDFRAFVQGLKDEEEEDFMTAVRDALLIEEP